MAAFYDLVETHPRGKSLLELHQNGHGVAHARLEQFNFLCGFMGGRNHYLEKHHHMNLKHMHEHLDITRDHAEDWLYCMALAMDETGLPTQEKTELSQAFRRVATALINSETE